jgi:hypothetical protein
LNCLNVLMFLFELEMKCLCDCTRMPEFVLGTPFDGLKALTITLDICYVLLNFSRPMTTDVITPSCELLGRS